MLLARVSLVEALLLAVIVGVAVVAGLVALRGRRGGPPDGGGRRS